nr:group II intron reverse transcriptase/maturase [Rhodomonas sp. NIES-1006]
MAGRMKGNSLQDKAIIFERRKVMDKSINYTSWESLPWEKFQIKLFRLQCRIYRAMQNGDIRKTVKLQKRLLTSQSTYFMAFKYITESTNLNTSISLSKLFFSDDEKIQFISNFHNSLSKAYYSSALRPPIGRCNNNSYGLLKLEDILVQCIWRYALEPVYKVTFRASLLNSRLESNSQSLNTQKRILSHLKNRGKQWNKKVLQIQVCNDWNTSKYQKLVDQLIFPLKYKTGIFRALQMGILDNNFSLPSTEEKDYSIVPLLIDIFLENLENLDLNKHKRTKFNKNLLPFAGFRFLNTCTYILEPENNTYRFLQKIKYFLSDEALRIMQSKRLITKLSYGFDFINWHFTATEDSYTLCYPSKQNWLRHKNRIKYVLKNPKYSIKKRIEKIRILNQSWYEYHSYSELRQIKAQIFSLRTWCIRYIKMNTKMNVSEIHFHMKEGFNNYSKSALNCSKKRKSIVANGR